MTWPLPYDEWLRQAGFDQDEMTACDTWGIDC